MMMNENYEAEDFNEIITFESGQFAIVDAEILKSLKDKIPMENKVIFVATKHSRDDASPFKVVARYDDATLRKLIITPAAADKAPDFKSDESIGESFDERRIETRKGSGVQKQGKGGNVVQRLTAKGRIAGARPKLAQRSERNKKGSSKGDQKAKLTKGKLPAEQRIDQAVSHQGAKLSNFGQPKVETECLDLLAHVKTKTITEEYLDGLEHARKIRSLLADVRDNHLVSDESFDLVYETIQILDEHWHKNACEWVKNIETLIEEGTLDV